MDIISAYREAGTFRGAAAICGTTPKTVRRVIARHEAGGGAPVRVPRERNYDVVAALVAERVGKTSGRISAKRLLPAARAAGYGGLEGLAVSGLRKLCFLKPLPAIPGTRCGPPAEAGTRSLSGDASDCSAVRCSVQYHA